TMHDKDIIAVDLDGTLAEYHGFKGEEHIGKPIPAMLERVKRWVKEGKTVVIFTARVHGPGAFPHIQKWLRDNGLEGLRITNKKEPAMEEFWDDRAVAIKRNTGEILGGNTRHDQSWEDGARKEMK